MPKYCHWCCADHDISADGEDINENGSTPVKRTSSLRTRRHPVARRESAKDCSKAADDTVCSNNIIEISLYVLLLLVLHSATGLYPYSTQLGIPVYSDHAIAAYFTYFAKMHISHIFPHIMAFSQFRIFIYAFRIFIYA